MANWIDGHFGRRQYGVQFSDGQIFNDNDTPMLTRDAMPKKVNMEKLVELSNEIRSLNPQSGDVYESEEFELVEVVQVLGEGEYSVVFHRRVDDSYGIVVGMLQSQFTKILTLTKRGDE